MLDEMHQELLREANGGAKVEPLSEARYKVTFTASEDLREKLRQASALLKHQVPDGDIAVILERSLDLLISDVRKKRFGLGRKARKVRSDGNGSDAGRSRYTAPGAAEKTSKEGRSPQGKPEESSWAENGRAKSGPAENGRAESSPAESGSTESSPTKKVSRHVPAWIRRAVLERDGEQCSYIDERGRRCPERALLELDHIEGFARKKEHTVEGIRVRCRAHNRWSAERLYGRKLMQAKRGQRRQAASKTTQGTRGPLFQ